MNVIINKHFWKYDGIMEYVIIYTWKLYVPLQSTDDLIYFTIAITPTFIVMQIAKQRHTA